MDSRSFMKIKPVEQIKKPEGPTEPKCICFRPKCPIMCRNCGTLSHGRLRLSCPMHSKVMFLMDVNKCPKCFVSCSNMSELR